MFRLYLYLIISAYVLPLASSQWMHIINEDVCMKSFTIDYECQTLYDIAENATDTTTTANSDVLLNFYARSLTNAYIVLAEETSSSLSSYEIVLGGGSNDPYESQIHRSNRAWIFEIDAFDINGRIHLVDFYNDSQSQND